jgi:hypothetical protein
MSPKQRHSLLGAANSPAAEATHGAAELSLKLRRLNRIARREPRAFVGVVQFWLGLQGAEGETRGDC